MTSRFGELLKRLRDEAGLTQEELANRAELGVRTLRRLETGTHGDVRTGTVHRLADALAKARIEDADELLRLLQDALFGVEPEDREREPESSRVAPAHWIPLAEAMNSLAIEVRAAWQREEDHRRVNDPFALPVSWRPVENLADHRENIIAAPPGAVVGELDLGGDLREIAGLYRSIPSGRLVVLGRAGSGKTILTLRFVLDYLESRAADEPVPAIFSLGSWDPNVSGLDEWLVGQLQRDHPGLSAHLPNGTTLAAALVAAGCVLPVLDGFDELAAGVHAAALRVLKAAPKRPLLLTSRTEHYTEVVRAEVLTGAAVIELTGLSHTDLRDYLPRTARPTGSVAGGRSATAWDPVLARLDGERPDPAGAELAAVLSTPLMVTLARTMYSDATGEDPADLLDGGRFPSREEIEDHLLDGYVPAVYRRQALAVGGRGARRWESGPAERFLRHLARHLYHDAGHERRDLAWWQLGLAVRPATRVLAVTIACTLFFDFAILLVTAPVALLDGESVGLVARTELVTAFTMGPVLGLAFGLVYGLRSMKLGPVLEPARVQLRLMRGIGPAARARLRRNRVYIAGGLIGGSTSAAGYTLALALDVRFGGGPALPGVQVLDPTVSSMLIVTLIFGSVSALVIGLLAVMETPIEVGSASTPTSLLAVNRTTALRELFLMMPLMTLGIAVGGRVWFYALYGALHAPSWGWYGGFVTGLIAGIGASLSYGICFTAWGQWVLFARIVLPLTGRLPWTPVAFLEDAYQRGVLRRAGAVYQFRHARLQDRLCRNTVSPGIEP